MNVMYSAHVTEVAKKEDLLKSIEFCDCKNQLKQDFTFPYFKDGVTIKPGTTNLSIGDSINTEPRM